MTEPKRFTQAHTAQQRRLRRLRKRALAGLQAAQDPAPRQRRLLAISDEEWEAAVKRDAEVASLAQAAMTTQSS